MRLDAPQADFTTLLCCHCCSLHYTRHAPLQAASNLKDVLQQLLPAEQDPKTTPPKTDATPQIPKDSSEKQDTKQPQRGSSTAKASTPKRQDQVTTKAAGSRSSDKGRQERERAHTGRHEPIRHHQQVRPCTTSWQCVSVVPVCPIHIWLSAAGTPGTCNLLTAKVTTAV